MQSLADELGVSESRVPSFGRSAAALEGRDEQPARSRPGRPEPRPNGRVAAASRVLRGGGDGLRPTRPDLRGRPSASSTRSAAARRTSGHRSRSSASRSTSSALLALRETVGLATLSPKQSKKSSLAGAVEPHPAPQRGRRARATSTPASPHIVTSGAPSRSSPCSSPHRRREPRQESTTTSTSSSTSSTRHRRPLPPLKVGRRQAVPRALGSVAEGRAGVPVQTGPPPTKLVTKDLKVGSGAVVKAIQSLSVDYIVSRARGQDLRLVVLEGHAASFR